MQGNVIRRGENFVKARGAHHAVIQVPGSLRRQERIASDDLHLQRQRGICNHAADGAQPDDTQRFSRQLIARKRGFALLHLPGDVRSVQSLYPFHAAQHIPRRQQQGTDGKLLDAVCVCAGRVENRNSRRRTAVNGNVVHTGTRTGNCRQPVTEGHLMHDGGAHQNAVRIGNVRPDPVARAELLQPHRGDLVQQLNVHASLLMSSGSRRQSPS